MTRRSRRQGKASGLSDTGVSPLPHNPGIVGQPKPQTLTLLINDGYGRLATIKKGFTLARSSPYFAPGPLTLDSRSRGNDPCGNRCPHIRGSIGRPAQITPSKAWWERRPLAVAAGRGRHVTARRLNVPLPRFPGACWFSLRAIVLGACDLSARKALPL